MTGIFDVYALNLWEGEFESWPGSDRLLIGEITVESGGNRLEAEDVFEAVSRFVYQEPEIPCGEIGCLDPEYVYVKDPSGTGEWWEVGVRKWHMPVYGLALKK